MTICQAFCSGDGVRDLDPIERSSHDCVGLLFQSCRPWLQFEKGQMNEILTKVAQTHDNVVSVADANWL